MKSRLLSACTAVLTSSSRSLPTSSALPFRATYTSRISSPSISAPSTRLQKLSMDRNSVFMLL